MAPTPSERMKAEVRRALDGEWRTAREIYARVGQWAFTSVRNALIALGEEGRADVLKGVDSPHVHDDLRATRYRTVA